MRANVQSFTRVREKTRYYLCKYLYYDLTTRIDRYILALQKGHVREEVMESLSVFRGISVLKRKKQSPAQAREILENSAVSLGEVFDSFNYFYFGYATLDWMAVLIEAYDSPEDLTERNVRKKRSSGQPAAFRLRSPPFRTRKPLKGSGSSRMRRKRSWTGSTRWIRKPEDIREDGEEKTRSENTCRDSWILTALPSSAFFSFLAVKQNFPKGSRSQRTGCHSF